MNKTTSCPNWDSQLFLKKLYLIRSKIDDNADQVVAIKNREAVPIQDERLQVSKVKKGDIDRSTLSNQNHQCDLRDF